MGCLRALLALISPRLALFLLWIFGDLLSRAFDSWIVPLLGFFLLPWMTLSYALFYEWGSGRHVHGIEWAFVDTPPNMSGAVTYAISEATLVVIPAIY